MENDRNILIIMKWFLYSCRTNAINEVLLSEDRTISKRMLWHFQLSIPKNLSIFANFTLRIAGIRESVFFRKKVAKIDGYGLRIANIRWYFMLQNNRSWLSSLSIFGKKLIVCLTQRTFLCIVLLLFEVPLSSIRFIRTDSALWLDWTLEICLINSPGFVKSATILRIFFHKVLALLSHLFWHWVNNTLNSSENFYGETNRLRRSWFDGAFRRIDTDFLIRGSFECLDVLIFPD